MPAVVYFSEALPLHEDDLACAALPFMPDEKAARVARCADSQQRVSMLLSEALLAYALKRSFALASEKEQRALSANGKPCWRDLAGKPCFSLSHSDSVAMVALSWNEVGADVQRVKPIDKRVARRVLGDASYRAWQDAEDKDRFFAECWVRLEAALKYTGEGLTGLSRVEEFAADHCDDVAPAPRGYAAAACSPEGVSAVDTVDLDEILASISPREGL